jgi:hypothetical protein
VHGLRWTHQHVDIVHTNALRCRKTHPRISCGLTISRWITAPKTGGWRRLARQAERAGKFDKLSSIFASAGSNGIILVRRDVAFATGSNYAEVVVRRQEADMTIWPT